MRWTPSPPTRRRSPPPDGLAVPHLVDPIDGGDVPTGPAVDGVACAVACRDNIAPLPGKDGVPPGAAGDTVGPRPACDDISTGATGQGVVRQATADAVVAEPSVDAVFVRPAEQDVDEDQENAAAVENDAESDRRFDAAYRILPFMFLIGVAFWGGLLWLTRVF